MTKQTQWEKRGETMSYTANVRISVQGFIARVKGKAGFGWYAHYKLPGQKVFSRIEVCCDSAEDAKAVFESRLQEIK